MILEQWRPGHLTHLIRLSSDPRIVRFIRDGKPWSIEYATDRHEKALAHWEEHGFGWYAALVDGQFAGVAALGDRGAAGVEIGWWVDPDLWGRGYATEMATLLRDKALARSRRVFAGHHHGNDASARVMAKIGLAYEYSYPDEFALNHVYELTTG